MSDDVRAQVEALLAAEAAPPVEEEEDPNKIPPWYGDRHPFDVWVAMYERMRPKLTLESDHAFYREGIEKWRKVKEAAAGG